MASSLPLALSNRLLGRGRKSRISEKGSTVLGNISTITVMVLPISSASDLTSASKRAFATIARVSCIISRFISTVPDGSG
ncbi:MAG TPA: hypothetical protein VNK81_07240 [Thermodesulfobacteriota bacterium]|nr:hypothetical protein [Thermodesulfobacteriota bacterium]